MRPFLYVVLRLYFICNRIQFGLSHFRSIRVSDQEDLEERRSRPIGAGAETDREASVDIQEVAGTQHR